MGRGPEVRHDTKYLTFCQRHREECVMKEEEKEYRKKGKGGKKGWRRI